jgi:radical SAM protein with 4Fe4S-binding SPASM domain
VTSISKLIFGGDEPNDRLRYAEGAHRRPIVVWNVTPKCNLACEHCYAAERGGADAVLDTGEAKRVIDDLAEWKVPVLLFSGGEPFCREDIRELAEYAKGKGLRVTFSTNGTLIDDNAADWLASLGTGYVGISIDGTEEMHDRFRRKAGAYAASVAAIRRLVARGVKVGLRLTVTRMNAAAIPDVFRLMRDENVPRICIYHLVYTGRGEALAANDLDAPERRAMMDSVIAETEKAFAEGRRIEVLTVDNHCDGPYVYLKRPSERVMGLLRLNGGNSSGEGIACISWDGTVYPDQFWRNHPVGNVRERPFSEIWGNPSPDSLLGMMRRKKELVKGRCRACRWLDVCGGNFRARGEAATGDIWGEDPSCYLETDTTRSEQ